MSEVLTITKSRNCWMDLWNAQRTVLRALGRRPIVAGITFAVCFLDGPETFSVTYWLLFLLRIALLTVLWLSVIVEAAHEQGLACKRPTSRTYLDALVLYVLQTFAFIAATVCFILPVLWVSMVTAVCYVVCCVERKGPVTALGDSVALSWRHFWYLVEYLGVPTLVTVAIPLIVRCLFGSGYLEIGNISPDDAIGSAIISFFDFWSIWAHLSLFPLVVFAYQRLKQIANKNLNLTAINTAEQDSVVQSINVTESGENYVETIKLHKNEHA